MSKSKKNLAARVDAIEASVATFGVKMDRVLDHLERVTAKPVTKPVAEPVTKPVTAGKPVGRPAGAPRDAFGRYLPNGAKPKTATARTATKPVAAKAKTAKQEAFVGWLAETAEARAARKKANKAATAWLASKGLPATGPVWEAVKAGERNVSKLRALAKAGPAPKVTRAGRDAVDLLLSSTTWPAKAAMVANLDAFDPAKVERLERAGFAPAEIAEILA